MDPSHEPAPGWYAQLVGAPFDLEDWVRTLNSPFDPIAFVDSTGATLLQAIDFADAENAEQVREIAIQTIDRLNGAMAVMHGGSPASLGGVIRLEEGGRRHVYVYVETAVSVVSGTRVRVVAHNTAHGSDEKPLVPTPPEPSLAQCWTNLAAADGNVADLLQQLGRAKDWYDIYKAIELAEEIAGGERGLRNMLGTTGPDFKNMRTTANWYRHARAHRPDPLTPFAEAKPLLYFAVRTVLDWQAKRKV